MNPRSFTATTFRQALEQRLRNQSRSGQDFVRRRQILVFHRFLARVAAEFGDAVTVKGALVLHARLHHSRITRDVDLGLMGTPGETLQRLQDAGRADLGDHMMFVVRPHDDHPVLEMAAMPYGGERFQVECSLGGSLYGDPFGVDVAFGERLFRAPDIAETPDVLAFAGILPPRIRLLPIETHIAEKVHAYTVPRPRPNSRVKDLPDLALLATVQPLDAKALRRGIEHCWTFRGTHALPTRFPDPSPLWAKPYARMAAQNELAWPTLAAVTTAVRAFLDPVLAGGLDATWDPAAWTWSCA